MPAAGERDNRNSLETRVRLLEEWRVRHRDEFKDGNERLSQLWDWRSKVDPTLVSIRWTLRGILTAIVIFILEQLYFHLGK